MIRLLLIVLLLAAPLSAQNVQPGDLSLKLRIEEAVETPYVGEMVLVTLEGTFRLPIIREKLIQPDLDGFSWMQLGPDYWEETREGGYPVKKFRRRMALFPDRAGDLEIGAFTHRLTLLGPGNKWVEYDIFSDPVPVSVAPQPQVDGWWLPVKRLKVADDWSNAPDSLSVGEGVLRVIRLEALGISPDLLPPMPEMKSPGAVIFPHPEKRLVDLTPRGPVAVAFWRWTVMPQNPPSAIIEPIELSFFDTVSRAMRRVTISPQRVAMRAEALSAVPPPPAPGRSRVGPMLTALAGGTGLGLAALLWRRGAAGRQEMLWRLGLHPDQRALSRAARNGDAMATWRAAQVMVRGDPAGHAAMSELEAALFGQGHPVPDLRVLRHRLLSCCASRQSD